MKTEQTTIAQAVASTPAQSSVAQATQAAPVSALRFVCLNRPARGNALFAHTAAAFQALGLFDGAYVERNVMLRVWGATALKYHAGMFRCEDGAYALNDEGFSKFGEWRDIDPDQAAAFYAMLTEGKGGDSLPQAYRGVKPL